MSERQALFVARQAGTASAFAAVIRLARTKGLEPVVLAYSWAQRELETRGVRFVPVESFEQARETLARAGSPRFMLTGTSHQCDEDAQYWAWARAAGCPSVGFVDQWANLRERFPARGPYPERVAVVDERARAGVEALGLPLGEIRATGSPVFDDLREAVGAAGGTGERAGPGLNERVAVFATEPFSLYGTEAQHRELHGHSDVDSYRAALDALEAHARATKERWKLLIKPHPRDERSRLEGWMRAGEGVDVELSSEGRERLFAQANLVLGMRSIFLLEAASLGIPVVSFQPARRTSCDLTDSRPGIEVVTEREVGAGAAAIRRALSEARAGKDRRIGALERALQPGAAARILEFVLESEGGADGSRAEVSNGR